MSINSTMTALADEVRELSGKTGKLTLAEMTTEVADGNANIADQTSLIAQIQTALEGKTASGGGGETGLPAGYRRVDYIQFSGEQVVDTEIVCNQNTRIQLAFTREKSPQHYLYGVASSDNTASVTAYLGGSWRFGDKAATKTLTESADMIYSAVVSNSEVTITGNKAAIRGVNAFETIGTLLIGTCRSASGEVGDAQFSGKIFFWTIQQGAEQVQKLVPVVSEDGVYRFFDLVTKTFFDSITDTPLGGGSI